MTLRNGIREWIGLDRTHRLAEETAREVADVRGDLKRIEEKIDALRAQKYEVAPAHYIDAEFEKFQYKALQEFDESKRGKH